MLFWKGKKEHFCKLSPVISNHYSYFSRTNRAYYWKIEANTVWFADLINLLSWWKLQCGLGNHLCIWSDTTWATAASNWSLVGLQMDSPSKVFSLILQRTLCSLVSHSNQNSSLLLCKFKLIFMVFYLFQSEMCFIAPGRCSQQTSNWYCKGKKEIMDACLLWVRGTLCITS